MREVKKIIIHCSDSLFGNAALIDLWHKKNGWEKIGYHYVILNARESQEKDGMIEKGRAEEEIGAHCKGHNKDSIGICLIGKDKFTVNQITSLNKLLLMLFNKYNLTSKEVYGHYEFDSNKTCPNIDMDEFRKEFVEIVKEA